LKKIYESLSIGFQVNRAIKIEHIMKRGLFDGFGLGVEEVRGLVIRSRVIFFLFLITLSAMVGFLDF
jgi:hypothetical protein